MRNVGVCLLGLFATAAMAATISSPRSLPGFPGGTEGLPTFTPLPGATASPSPSPSVSPAPSTTPLAASSPTAELKGVFMLHPAGDFQSCMGWRYEQTTDPNHTGATWIKPIIESCRISGGEALHDQVVVTDINTGQPWDGKTDAKVTIQNRAQQGYFTNPDEDIGGQRIVYGKEVHLEGLAHPVEGRGESQRQVWEIKLDPASGWAAVATDIGSILYGATRECLQNYANTKPVRTPCTGEYYWQFQPVLH